MTKLEDLDYANEVISGCITMLRYEIEKLNIAVEIIEADTTLTPATKAQKLNDLAKVQLGLKAQINTLGAL